MNLALVIQITLFWCNLQRCTMLFIIEANLLKCFISPLDVSVEISVILDIIVWSGIKNFTQSFDY